MEDLDIMIPKMTQREFAMLGMGSEELEDYSELVEIWMEFLRQKGDL